MDVIEHLDAETIYELIEGRLEPHGERAAEAHLWRCDACRELREECAATLGALRWYSQRTPAAPLGYWEEFWARWRIAGGLDRPASRPRRWVPALAAAATLLLAIVLWREITPEGEGGEVVQDLGSPTTAGLASTAAPPTRELFAGTPWEEDVEVLERITFAVGSVDPLSKGVVLASLPREP